MSYCIAIRKETNMETVHINQNNWPHVGYAAKPVPSVMPEVVRFPKIRGWVLLPHD